MKLPNIVALCGPAKSGKSTCANHLVRSHGYTLLKFATPLKDMLRAIGLNEIEIEGDLKEVSTPLLCGKSPRFAMQTLGTEWGRNMIGETFWVDLWKYKATQILGAGGRVVVDDCRFDNELMAARSLDAFAIRIHRPGVESIGNHVSEAGIKAGLMPIIHNDADVSHLMERVLGAMNK